MATMTARKPKAKPTQLMAVSEIMLTAEGPLTLKEIAKKATRLTGKPASEAAVSARLRDLRKPKGANLNVIRTAGPTKGVFLYEVQVKTLAQAVEPNLPLNYPVRPITFGRPASNVGNYPVRPITFGRPASNVGVDKVGVAPPSPVAGSRSAMAFAETLK